MPSEPPSAFVAPSARRLLSWEVAMIEMFVRAANLIGLPRSVGEIYGVLYCAERPLTFDDQVERLGISKGSVSQGLKLLRQFGAVKVQYIAGSRKDHYAPELSIKRLMRGFIQDQFNPHLQSGASRIEGIRDLVDAEQNPALREHARERLGTLISWQARMVKLLPVITAVLGGADSCRPMTPTTASSSNPWPTS